MKIRRTNSASRKMFPPQRGARTMALDPAKHHIFLVTAKFGPPPASTAEQPHPWPAILPDSFVVLVVGK